jgi:GAF domain-containing protein
LTFRFGRPSFSEALLTQANKSGCPFQGTMTPDTRIPLNQGICGAAASAGKTIVVDDVAADAPCLFPRDQIGNRRTCFVHGKVAGELDIDSHFLAAIGPDDRKLCEHAAALLGKIQREIQS